MNEAVKAGRRKSEEKAAAILCAASELFLESGFQGTSIDAVAKRAGVSKQTVYSHYAGKDDLFRACIRSKVASYGFAETVVEPHAELRTALRAMIRRFLDLLFDPQVIAMHRVVMGESASHPAIAELFYESGPGRTQAAVRRYLEEQVGAGRLAIPGDRLHYAAVQVLNMAFGEYQLELLMGLIESVDEEELSVHLDRVVDDFLRLYGIARQAGPSA